MLLANGFTPGGRELEGRPTLGRDCCGPFDAVLWPFTTGLGALVAFAGIGLAVTRRKRLAESTRTGLTEQNQPSAT